MDKTIQCYEASTKTFEQPVSYKVKKLLELKLISKQSDGLFRCLPIPGYNSTTYTIREIASSLFCNCQAGRKGRECAHIRAVRIHKQQTEPKEQQLCLNI